VVKFGVVHIGTSVTKSHHTAAFGHVLSYWLYVYDYTTNEDTGVVVADENLSVE